MNNPPTPEKSRILVYAFNHKKKQNISSLVLNQLTGVDKIVIDSTNNQTGLKEIDNLLQKIKESDYKFIVGLGIYSAKSSILKIELSAKNKFRNNSIDTTQKEDYRFNISEFIKIPEGIDSIKFSNKMGNSWCNLSAYKISSLIKNDNLESRTGFIHIPNIAEEVESYTIMIQDIINNFIKIKHNMDNLL